MQILLAAFGVALLSLVGLGWLYHGEIKYSAKVEARAAEYQQNLDLSTAENTRLLDERKRLGRILTTRDKNMAHIRSRITELQQQLSEAPDASQEYINCRAVDLPASAVQRLRAATGAHTNSKNAATDNPNP